MNKGENITKISKPAVKGSEEERIALYDKASYFKEKDRKAIEFLKKHPIPSKFLK